MSRLLLSAFSLALLSSAGCTAIHQMKSDLKWKNKPALDFELEKFEGGKVKLSDYLGKPVLLSFFAFG